MIPTGSILALKTRGKYKKKYLKYAKNPEEVPNEKDFFRIFLSNLMILRHPLNYL